MTTQNQNNQNDPNNQNNTSRPTVSILTLGCKVNQYETQALKERFTAMGYAVMTVGKAVDTSNTDVPDQQDKADVYVINTCTVTSLSDKKSRQYIRKAHRKNPQAIIAVTGCFAQVSPEEAAAIEGVSIVVGTQEKHSLPELVEAYRRRLQPVSTQPQVTPWQEMTAYEDTGAIVSMDTRTRAFIKIEEGCDRFCSYCIIPYARGSVRSRRLADIVEEARQLIDQGFKELVLTGINTALYSPQATDAPQVPDAPGVDTSGGQNASGEPGVDAPGAPDAPSGAQALSLSGRSEPQRQGVEAVIAALDSLPGDFRIRLGSLEPTVVDEFYAAKLLAYEKLCPHMHLSVQSGSDRILAAMNRHYTQKEYLAILSVLKGYDDGYGVTTDIITGFPGETEEDFAGSAKLVEMADFCKVHVFPYSERKGTKAARMPDQLPSQIKSERSAALSQLAEEGSNRFFTKNIGTVRTVLVEETVPVSASKREEPAGHEPDKDAILLTGYTENYIKVYIEGETNLINTFCKVRLTGLFRDGMTGVQIESQA